jgi:hypothetical protein
MKTLFRAFGLTAAFALVGLAATHSQTIGTCRYLCLNNSTGKVIPSESQVTERTCCDGAPLSCPPNYSFDAGTTWNGESCS